MSGGYAQTAKVLQMMDEVYRAHRDKRDDDFARLSREVMALDSVRVGAIHGGIVIGEIPDPARNYEAWEEFVQSAVDAATEELAQATSCGDECRSTPAGCCLTATCSCECHSCCVPLDDSCESCRDEHEAAGPTTEDGDA